MSNSKSITVIGGTGKLGSPVVKNLLNQQFRIRLIARNPEKAEQIFGQSADLEIIQADLSDTSSLKNALKGSAYLYLNLSTQTTNLNIPFAAEREGIRNILDSVDRKAIRQIIMISGLGALDNHSEPGGFEFIPNIIRKQGHRMLKESGIPYTILHCSWFIDSFIVYRRKGTYMVIGNSTDPIYFTNCGDYTMHLVNALDNPEALFREFPIQGQEGIGHLKAARQFLDIYDPSSKVKLLAPGLLKILSVFSRDMKFVRHMADYTMQCPETHLAEEFGTYEVLGDPRFTLSEYAHTLNTNA